MPRPRLFALVLIGALTIALIFGGRGLIGQRPSNALDSSAVTELMEGPSGLEEVQLSEELVREHPFIYAGIHLEKIYELNLNSRTFTADGEI